VFNVNTNDGFVIVSADDRAYPIIGYSTKRQYVVPNKKSPFSVWMSKRKAEIISIQTNITNADARVTKQWTTYTNNSARLANPNSVLTASVAPLVQTTWNQSPFYNDSCPGGSVTGCVACAMSQIMRFWNYPAKGQGSSSYCDCTPTFSENYGTLSANYGATNYNWANMPLSISSDNTEIARLMSHSGISVQMDYSPSGSGAWVITADDSICAQNSYVKYFKYNPNTIQGLLRSNYTDTAWIVLIENELTHGRPVQYVGWDPSAGGHTWVCDGFDEDSNLDMNWGWGGECDGFYSINALAPTGSGYDFSQTNQAVIGIEPLDVFKNDAGIAAIVNPTGAYCSNSVNPVVTLENYGTNTLTTCTLNYYIDNQAVQTQSWSGSLANNQTANVSIPSFTTTAGTHTFTCYTSNPNGGLDSNASNNQSVSVFVYGVEASFAASQVSLCTIPATIQFTNGTINGASYTWTFGDGGTSTTASPSHTYTVAGTYQVKMVAQGLSSCPSVDSTTTTIYIENGPKAATCTPTTQDGNSEYGILNFSLNTINNSSGYSIEGYKDFTCTNSTVLTAGNIYTVSVTTGPYNENVKIWIDYNNDGQFNSTNELVFTSNDSIGVVIGKIFTPVTAVLNTPLRLRVMDESYYYTISGPCYNPYYGQAEDYTVIFNANTSPPICNFAANITTVLAGSTVNFTDLSNNVPTAWSWSFSGGTPTNSTTQNPSVVYNTLGTYPVTLKVSNSFGSDSLTKTAYIHVVNGLNMCSANTTYLPTGTLFDSGGPNGHYGNDENCSLLINPGCASSITLSFESFNTYSYYDVFMVYDGNSTSGTLLLDASGTSLPNSVTATSGEMFIKWTSSNYNYFGNYQASWTSVLKTNQPPVAKFTPSTLAPPYNVPVGFTDNSTQYPDMWQWNFGDGTSSTLQNPSHTYSTPGTKTVTLIATNCISSDTTYKVLTVQQPPTIQLSPDTLRASIGCNDSAMLYLKVQNTGGGTLVSSFSGNYSDSVNILVFTDSYNTTYYSNLILAIRQYFQKIKITLFTGTTPSALQAALTKQDVLLFPAQSSSVSYFSTLSTVVQNFANKGGTVIVTGCPYNTTKMYEMGLFTGNFEGELYGSGTLNVDTANKITKGLPISFTPPYYTYYNNITNTNKIELVSYAGYDVVTYCNSGLGKAIYMGFDYYMYGNQTAQLISNAVENALPYGLTEWINLNKYTDTVGVSSKDSVLVKFKSAGYNDGVYTSAIIVQSNDSLNPSISIPCIMTVDGVAGYSVNPTSCINFGTVMQYASKSDSVFITNTGCDTLKITSIVSGLSTYTFSPSSLTIMPGVTKGISITFSPIVTGTQSSTLTFTTNIGIKTVCVTGNASSAPIFSVTPKNITVNLPACGASNTTAVAAQNSGQGILLYSVPGCGGVASQDSVHVLVMTYGIDMTTRYPNMITAITQYYPLVSFTQHSYTTPSALSSALQNKQVILFPSQINGTDYYTQMASVVQGFVSNGGTAIVCGSTYTGSSLYELGLFTGTYQGYLYSGTALTVLDTTNKITKDLPLSITTDYYTMYQSITNSDKKELVEYGTYDIVSYRSIGSGTAVYIGYDYYDVDVNSNKILSNAVKLTSNNIPSWISLSTCAGNVAPNAADSIRITVSSTGLSGGTYTSNIIIQSNDPRNPADTVSYTLNISYNPCANFSHHLASACGSTVSFTDSSLNLPNSWNWSFGDGTTSTQANPSHTYSTAGTYTVKLKVCNTFGCDSIAKSITVNPGNPPSPALCTPAATNPCCGYGIYNVTLNTINNSSGASTEGYKDFTCTESTTLVSGQTYSISITTSSSEYETVEVWIDFNNNGIWDSNELVFSSVYTLTYHTGSITIPNTAVLNTPLRMRVGDDEYTYTLTGCSVPYEGQYEDYTVIISPNSLPPVTDFSYINTNSCAGSFSFTDLSTNNPTSWAWNFGDGGLSSIENPTHMYTASGTYTVTLVSTNSFGSTVYYQVINVNSLSASINITGNYAAGNSLTFSSSYTTALSYSWNFGDGSSSGLQTPTHSYFSPGTYVVALNLVTAACTVTEYDTITIGVTGISTISSAFNNVLVAPNPFSNSCVMKYTLTNNSSVSIDVLNVIGQTILPIKSLDNQAPGSYEMPIAIETPGVYFLRVEINGVFKLYKIISQ
jgi:PKD repeat protein